MSVDLISRWLQRAALAVHDAEQRLDRVVDQAPGSPEIGDPEAVTNDERDAIRLYLARFDAWRDQREAAKADVNDARRRHADAYRLATGLQIDEIDSSVLAFAVGCHGAGEVVKQCQEPPREPEPGAPTRRMPRRRGAGRPRAQATRSSAKSGDSDDDAPGEPEPEGPSRLARLKRAVLTFGLLSAAERGAEVDENGGQ